MMWGRCGPVVIGGVVFCLLGLSVPAEAWIFDPNGGDWTMQWRLTAKNTVVAARAPDAPAWYAKRDTLTDLVRVRVGLEVGWEDGTRSEVAYEQRARWVSDPAATGAAGAFLPSQAEPPYRLRALDWQILEDDDRFVWRGEIDRMLLSFRPNWGEVTVGRQAIGLGRGVLFSAVDVFSPFSALEVDREWRRGVDAVRTEVHLSETSSAESLLVLGPSWDQSALLGRIRGYVGSVDGEVIFGKRGRDTLVGLVSSAVVGDAEVHGELAWFDTPDAYDNGGLFGSDGAVAKAVIGSSYTFGIGNGLTLLGEYHYSGFGVQDTSRAAGRLMDEDWQQRLLRGDAQILGKHALAAQLSYPFNVSLSGSLLVLNNPTDGSGVISPTLRWDMSDDVSLTGSLFVPWGPEPKGLDFGSEYGGTPLSLVVQCTMYF